MKYRFEHEFQCDRATLIRTMFEKDVTEQLKPLMPKMTVAETLEWSEASGRIKRRVRYMPVPKIKSVGPKTVDPRWMEFIEESQADPERGTATYANVPAIPQIAKLLKNRGEIAFESLGPNRTRRVMTGELRVEVFLLGSIAERVIHGYAKELVDEETQALEKLINQRAKA